MKRVENIVAKEDIYCFEQFLLLSQSFQKSSAAEASDSVYMRESVNLSYYEEGNRKSKTVNAKL